MEKQLTLAHIIDGKAKDLGDFQVRRVLPYAKKRMVGPFVFFDHMGPVDLKVGNGMDVRPHPHIGLSTLTYLFEGEILHKDTLGVEQVISPGAVNWMTAGKGVAHSERSPQESRAQAQRLHGLQIWIALPKIHEEVDPAFHHHSAKSIPEISYNDSELRLVAGQFGTQKSPVETFSELLYLDIKTPKGKTFEMMPVGLELAVYVVSGAIEAGGTILKPGQMGVFPELKVTVSYRALENSQVMLLGGRPLREERHIWWNFVSSSKERIEQAKQDWREGKFGKIQGETEYIPLPE